MKRRDGEVRTGLEGKLRGAVRRGRARGRKLGFPTANLDVGPQLPDGLESGVYLGWARWLDGPEHAAVLNIGVRPTFGEEHLSVEVHVLDFSGDLYGQVMDVRVGRRIRGERAFESAEALVRQIELDIETARALL